MQARLQSGHIDQIRAYLYHYFENHRRSFPWRETTNPYHILVSEIMLQQTQTDRVIPKFNAFIQQLPTVQDLAEAGPATVIRLWQGLGYNRRGLNLHRAARQIVDRYAGEIPETQSELESLAGIGPYTASAIRAFAFNRPSIVIETNIRTVLLYHFFPDAKNKVDDKQLVPLLEQLLDKKNPRKWYSALMDYGSFLKKTFPNPSRKSKHYQKQSTFQGSDRQIRGKILKLLTQQLLLKRKDFSYHFKQEPARALKLADALVEEGFLTKTKNTYQLA